MGSSFAVGKIGLDYASPIMLVTVLLIKCTSRGPVIFKQERVGLHNKPFKMYKFRTMCNSLAPHFRQT